MSAAPKITALPSDLQPSLLNAQNDLLRPTDAKCQPISQIQSGAACTYNYSSNPSAPMMVLLGDSHAWMWATSLAEVAHRTGYNFTMIYHSSCRMPLIAFADSPGTTNAQCVQWKQSVFDWISQANPNLIVVATQDAGPIDQHGNSISQSTYNAGLVAMLDKVSAPGRRVVLLGDIPVLSQDGPTCLAANESAVQNCSSPTDTAVRSRTQEGQSSAAAQAGAAYIYTIPWLCTTSVCPAVIGNYEVYQDKYHITSTYGNYLSNVLQSALGLVG